MYNVHEQKMVIVTLGKFLKKIGTLGRYMYLNRDLKWIL